MNGSKTEHISRMSITPARGNRLVGLNSVAASLKKDRLMKEKKHSEKKV
jgi:hypothetical protein